MVIYTATADIPPSPREPSEPFTGDTLMEESFGAPIEQTKVCHFNCNGSTWCSPVNQIREAQYLAGQNRQPVTAQPPTPDISALFRILSTQQQVPAQQPQPQPQLQPPPVASATSTGLEQIFAQFASVNHQQQAQQTQLPQVQQPTSGFNLQAALAKMSQPNQFGAPQAAPVANLQSILAGLNSQQPAPQAPPMQGYGFSNQYQNENDRKRQYEQDDGEYGFGKGKRSRQGATQGKKPVC